MIGNGAYAHVKALPNPPNDARAVAADSHQTRPIDSDAVRQPGFRQVFVTQNVDAAIPATDDGAARADRHVGDGVEHALSRGVDRGGRRQAGQDRLKPGDAPGVQQQGLELMAARPGGGGQHHLALGHEAPLTADQVPFADLTEGVDARVGGIVDGDQHGRDVSGAVPPVGGQAGQLRAPRR